MKKFLIYLSAIGVGLAVIPIQAEAGPRDKKKCGPRARHYSYFTRAYYRYYHPHYYWRYADRFWCHRYVYPYYGYIRPGVSFTFQFD